MPVQQALASSRDELESGLHAIALLLFRNELKPDTAKAIQDLKAGQVCYSAASAAAAVITAAAAAAAAVSALNSHAECVAMSLLLMLSLLLLLLLMLSLLLLGVCKAPALTHCSQ